MKKTEKKKATTTKTTRKFAEKTFKVNKCMTSATEILPPRERRRSKRSLQSSGPTFFSVCATLPQYTGEKKKEKGKLVKCRTADTTTTKKVLGVHSACTRTMPGPEISTSMIWDRSWHAKPGRKITLSGFRPFFKPRLPQEDGAHLCPYRGIIGTDFDSKR